MLIYAYLGSCLTFSLICNVNSDAADNQLTEWAEHHDLRNKPVTSFWGSPLKSETASLTTDPINGPILFDDTTLTEVLAHFDRERTPERVVHAKGAGAFGTFKVTHDISKLTKAKVFQPGEETEVFARFSTTGGELGAADTLLDTRGFAIKYYTRDGTLDLLGINLKVFPIHDAILFPSLIHSRKRNPVTHLQDASSFWDFTSLTPETSNNLIYLFSGLGNPDGFRHMNGFAVSAFKFVNEDGNVHYVKFHYITQQGIKNMSFADAVTTAGEDPDYAIRDLYNAIENKNFPSWKLYIQIRTREDAENDPAAFDATQIWDENEYPLRPVGLLTFYRNPKNYFNDVEQVAFDAGNLVPGIESSPDRLFQGRTFPYSDTQRYRLGSNFLMLPINRPKHVTVQNYMRDGQSCIFSQGGAPNYYPKSFNGPAVLNNIDSKFWVDGIAARVDSGPIGDNFYQAKELYYSFSHADKKYLIDNIVRSLKKAVFPVQMRALKNIFANIDKKLRNRIRSGLGL